MRKSELTNCPQWLLDADTHNENVEVVNGVVQWYGGAFRGEFLDGNFLDGNFLDGNFRAGNFRGGEFLGGNFRGGNFLGGSFLGGNFRGGNFLGGNFLGGAFLAGNFRGGNFRAGNFRGGEFLGGAFWGGAFWGGEFLDGTVNGVEGAKVITTFTTCDGWPKTLVNVGGVAWVLAGCRWFTLADAKKHWKGRKDRVYTCAMLHGAAVLAKHLGLKEQ